MNDSIYNKEALDALEEHSEAEEMARIASPKVKLVLAAMVAMMLVVLYWCFFGTINYKVKAQGIVFPFGEALPLSAAYDGSVARIMIKPNSSLSRNTVVMVLQADSVKTAEAGVLTSVLLSDTAATDSLARAQVPQVSKLDTVQVPCDGVIIQTLPVGMEFKAGEPVAWVLPQSKEMAGREMLCYVPYSELRKLRVGQQVQVTPANMEREDWGYAYGTLADIEQYPMTQQEIVDRLKLDALAAFITDGQAMCEVRVTLDMSDGSLVWSRDKSRGVKVPNGTLCNIQVISQRKPVWKVLVGAVDNAVQSVAGN